MSLLPGSPTTMANPQSFNNMKKHRNIERVVAVCSFSSAVVLAFLSVLITDDNDIPNGNLVMCAQFLTLTATIFGVDYKFSQHDAEQPDS